MTNYLVKGFPSHITLSNKIELDFNSNNMSSIYVTHNLKHYFKYIPEAIEFPNCTSSKCISYGDIDNTIDNHLNKWKLIKHFLTDPTIIKKHLEVSDIKTIIFDDIHKWYINKNSCIPEHLFFFGIFIKMGYNFNQTIFPAMQHTNYCKDNNFKIKVNILLFLLLKNCFCFVILIIY